MGIAQRTISAEFGPKLAKTSPKAIPASPKTLAGWIRQNRLGKNMTEGHLGAKLGVGAEAVRAWEDGVVEPNADHLERLDVILRSVRSYAAGPPGKA